MKKSRLTFLITAVVITALYLATAIFSLGAFFVPSSAWRIESSNADRENSLADAFVTVDIAVNKPDGDDVKKTGVSNIYVYIGNVYSYDLDENGSPYVQINFQFKTKSATTDTSFMEKVTVKVPVKYSTGGFEWVKVFDAEKEGKNQISYARVKITTPDKFDFYGVAFTDKDGYHVPLTVADVGSKEQKECTSAVIDERDTFIASLSRKYHFTDAELKNVGAVQSLRDGKAQVGEAPLTTIIQYLGTALTGGNISPFGMRIFDCIAGLGILLLIYAFAYKLFEKSRYAVVAVIFALSIGGVFTASTVALGGAIGALFALASLFFTVKYFIEDYYGDQKSATINMLLIGLFFALAVASDMAYSFLIVGIALLLIFAGARAHKEYKNRELNAQGLEKENVFLAYRASRVKTTLLGILSLVVIPVAIFLIAYAICSGAYQRVYGAGFIGSAATHFIRSITPAYESNPFALFAGFGGAQVGGYHFFLNYVATIVALVSFIFVTVAVICRKKVEFFKAVPPVANKYKILLASLVGFAIPVFMGLTSSPVGFAGVSSIMAIFVCFAESILKKCVKTKTATLVVNISAILSLVLFAMAYVGIVGLALPEIVNSILYIWQVL